LAGAAQSVNFDLHLLAEFLSKCFYFLEKCGV